MPVSYSLSESSVVVMYGLDYILILATFTLKVKAQSPFCYDEPSVMRLHTCCDVPFTDRIYEKCKHELIKRTQNDTELDAAITSEELIFSMCAAECEFEAKNYLRGADDIDFDILRKYLEENYAHDPDYIENYIKGIHDCIDYARSETKRYAAAQTWICNFFPGFLRKCAFEAAVYNCPPRRWDTSERCEEVKMWLKQCSPFKKS